MTLRQLLAMAEGKARSEWSHTSAILALLANCHRDPKKHSRPFRPEDFDPHADRDPATNRQSLSKMRSLLTRNRKEIQNDGRD